MGKYCKKCVRFLELEDFYKTKNKSYIDGHIDWCKLCIYEYRKSKKVEKKEEPLFFMEQKEIIIHFD
jgi:hypothetical protein